MRKSTPEYLPFTVALQVPATNRDSKIIAVNMHLDIIAKVNLPLYFAGFQLGGDRLQVFLQPGSLILNFAMDVRMKVLVGNERFDFGHVTAHGSFVKFFDRLPDLLLNLNHFVCPS